MRPGARRGPSREAAHQLSIASFDLGRGSRTSSLETLASASSRVDGTVQVLVVRGNLPVDDGTDTEAAWLDALTGVTAASQLTIGVIEIVPSADDAAALLLCDVVIAAEDASLAGWHHSLPPPSVAATGSLHSWLLPDPWTVARAQSAGLVDEVVAASDIEARLAEWVGVVASWDSGELREAQAVVKQAARPQLLSAVAAWSQSRTRRSMGE